MGWPKGKSRKLVEDVVQSVKDVFSNTPDEPVQPPVILAEPEDLTKVSVDDAPDKTVIRFSGTETEMIVKIHLDHDVYEYIKTVCEGRGQSFSECISQTLKFSRDNGFL